VAGIENVIIVGSGPAGYTAALYTARANLRPLVIEGFLWGGLLQQTTEVENYPGFPAGGIQGPELMTKMREQAEDFGTRFITDLATKVELSNEPGGIHKVWVGDDEYQARTVVLAMGAEHKKLGVPGEEELGGAGVSYCATVRRRLLQGARHRSSSAAATPPWRRPSSWPKFASKVLRGPPSRRVPRLEDHARARPGDRQHRVPHPYVVEEFHEGDGRSAASRACATTRPARSASCRSAAPSSHRHEPQSEIVEGQVPTDDEGYVVTEGKSTRTGVPGVFAAGRPRRPHLPPGRARPPARLPGGARRRVVPARHAAGADARGASEGDLAEAQWVRPRARPRSRAPKGQLTKSGSALLSAAAARTAPRVPAFLAPVFLARAGAGRAALARVLRAAALRLVALRLAFFLAAGLAGRGLAAAGVVAGASAVVTGAGAAAGAAPPRTRASGRRSTATSRRAGR
jgi:thioredoxin reductase (NADPH)